MLGETENGGILCLMHSDQGPFTKRQSPSCTDSKATYGPCPEEVFPPFSQLRAFRPLNSQDLIT